MCVYSKPPNYCASSKHSLCLSIYKYLSRPCSNYHAVSSFFLAVSCLFLLFSAFSAFLCLSGWVPSGSEAGQLPTFQQRLVVAILQNKNRPSTEPKFNRVLLLCFGLPTRKITNKQEKARKGRERQRNTEFKQNTCMAKVLPSAAEQLTSIQRL